MIDYIKIKQGLDIPMEGIPKPQMKEIIVSDLYAMKPSDYRSVSPKLVVKEGDRVLAGSTVFVDKYHPNIKFSSPVSGTIEKIVRGEKRRLLEIRIRADKSIEYLQFNTNKVESLSDVEIKNLLLDSGLWACIKQRPYGIIADPDTTPKAIFISAFNTAPLSSDLNFTLRNEADTIQVAIDALSKISNNKIFIGLNANDYLTSPLYKLNGVSHKQFSNIHPAGNVGVQIHHVSPINKGELVWTIDAHLLVAIGKLFSKGIYDLSRLIAVGGPRIDSPSYIKGVAGMSIKCIQNMIIPSDKDKTKEECGVRCISGNVLTGKDVGVDGFLGFYDDQISVLTEGNYYEMFGWAKPFRAKKFSFSGTYFSWLIPNKKYSLDTNLNGGERAFVLSDKYAQVLPMDILPVYLLKAILAGDIDKMEQLGIYEVIEEDFALCEYICPSKIEIQEIISNGIDMMIKEMS